MPFYEYTSLISTYRPPDLGSMELRILDHIANIESQSAYGIFKDSGKTVAYKDVHKRVKRLTELKLIEQIDQHFKRGAIHYRITSYGLITKLSSMEINPNHKFILAHRKSNVIQSLLLQFFEEQTIDSFYFMKEFPMEDIGYYLHDCAAIIRDICKKFWIEFDRYKITDILPSDDVIQKYMAYLDKKLVDQKVLDEIKNYEKRLQNKLRDQDTTNENVISELARAVSSYNEHHFHHRDEYYESHNPFVRDFREETPPFPFLEIYNDIVVTVGIALEERVHSLAFSLVSHMGRIIDREKIQSKQQLEEDILEWCRDYSLEYMLKDKNIIELIREIGKNFEIGYQQFMYYHKMVL